MEKIIPILILVIVRVILKNRRKKNKKYDIGKNNNIIRQPKEFKIAGYIIMCGSILILILTFIFYADNDDGILILNRIFWGFLSIGGLVTILFEKKWKIQLLDDQIIFTNMLGKTKKYSVEELYFKSINSGYRVYKDKKHLFGVGFYCVNYNLFCNKVIKHHRRKNKK